MDVPGPRLVAHILSFAETVFEILARDRPPSGNCGEALSAPGSRTTSIVAPDDKPLAVPQLQQQSAGAVAIPRTRGQEEPEGLDESLTPLSFLPASKPRVSTPLIDWKSINPALDPAPPFLACAYLGPQRIAQQTRTTAHANASEICQKCVRFEGFAAHAPPIPPLTRHPTTPLPTPPSCPLTILPTPPS